MSVRIERFGEFALVADAGGAGSLDVQRRIWVLARAARAWAGVDDAVAGANNLTLLFDPDLADPAQLERALRDGWEAGEEPAPGCERTHEIPVTYGGDGGPDLEAVARATGLRSEEVAARHAAGEYVAYFVGFVPGFAYLRGLDPVLQLPRRADPRVAVPAGSVAIAGEYTAVYPFRTPGGWHVIGRTVFALFDPARAEPATIAPGDRVRFVAVPP